MPTEAAAKPKQETWLDWLSPDQLEPKPLLTREELVERVRALGVKVSPGDIRYWETIGVLPRAVKRWHGDATRALYPEWMAALIVTIREMQHDDVPLDEIRDRLRATFYRSHEKQGDGTRLLSHVEQSALIYGHEDVQPALIGLARRHEQSTGQVVSAVQVSLLDHEHNVIRRHTMLLPSVGDHRAKLPRSSEQTG